MRNATRRLGSDVHMSAVTRLTFAPTGQSHRRRPTAYSLRFTKMTVAGMLKLTSLVLFQAVAITAQRTKSLYPQVNVTTDDIPDLPDGIPPAMTGMPRDCAEVMDSRSSGSGGSIPPSGIYTIAPVTCPGVYFNVYCDMDHEGGGWTVIQRRFNGSVDFYRGWYFYKSGFGQINGEYYLGNERIHCLTSQKHMELKISLTDVGGIKTIAGYSHFQVGNESTYFTLNVDSYYGDAGDYLLKSNGRPFSTFDRDYDGTSKNCAEYFHSAWWYFLYGDCHHAVNLNGYYFLGRQELPQFAGPGLSWRPVPGPGGPALKEVLMKIRPMGFLGGTRSSDFQISRA